MSTPDEGPPSPPTRPPFFAGLLSSYGWRFLAFLGISQAALKGILIYTISNLALPVFKGVMGVDAASMQIFLMITMIPWSLKPLIGILSDAITVGGYHKRPWLLQSLVVGSFCAGLAFLAFSSRSPMALSLCLCGVNFQIAVYDLMSEASYSERMRANAGGGNDIVTLVQTYQLVGGLVATLFVGFMADAQLYYALLGIVFALCVTPLVPVLWGWLPEARVVVDGAHAGFIRLQSPEWVHENKRMLIVIACTGLAAPVTAVVANLGDAAVGLALAALFTAAACVAAFFVFPTLIARVALYQVLRNLSRPNLGSAMDYWYTASRECVADGPHFSYAYYMTVGGLIGALAGIAGSILYRRFLTRLSYRRVLILTTILTGVVGASDLIIVTRLNERVGVPDWAAYLVGEAIMEPALGMLNYIPTQALLSMVVTPGMESSQFAFMAGINNFAGMISELDGALLFDAAGVVTTGGSECNFSALPWLILVCHVVLPTVVGVAAAWALIPHMEQQQHIEDVSHSFASGSGQQIELDAESDAEI
jgi:hypothetical protein